jgi:hypothetical protein
MSRPRNVSALLIGNGTLRSGLEIWSRRRGFGDPRRDGLSGSYLDHGDADSPGSGTMIFPVVGEPAAGC